MIYTKDDIVYTRLGKRQQMNVNDWRNPQYEMRTVPEYRTKDGLFYTMTESDGYSYWYSSVDKLFVGHRSYNYLFILQEPDLANAAETLNKALDYSFPK